jgi:predicted nucleic acid-binding protein
VILVDSSVWIDALIDAKREPGATDRIGEAAVCGPILQEVLQGLDAGNPMSASFRNRFLALPRLSDPVSDELYVKAAEIYLQGRRRGFTIRAGADCLIAAIAIENEVILWHKDRDFDFISRYTPLRAVTRIR